MILKRKNAALGTNGTTIAEVAVAFMVLMIGLAMFYKIVSFANNMLNESLSQIEQNENFGKIVYQKDALSDSKKNKKRGSNYTLIIDSDSYPESGNVAKPDEVILAIPNMELYQYQDSEYSFSYFKRSEEGTGGADEKN